MAKQSFTEELILQAQHAEREAQRRILFNEVVQRYQAMAYQYAYSILDDAQLAQDATQEGFLTAYQLLFQLRDAEAFPAWLQRILHSHCCRLLKQERTPAQSLELSDEVISEGLSPQAAFEQLEFQKAIRATIDSLPKNQQAPVALYYLDNYSQLEIAEKLNLSLSAVKKRLERARTHLAERMRGMAEEHLRSIAQERGIPATLFAALMESAAEEGQYTLLEALLVEGMDVDEQDASGQTVLHWAAGGGHVDAVELLLRYHADAARRDHSGRTALQLAVEGRNSEVAKRLRHYTQEQ